MTVKALACELPAETGVPLSRWSAPDLAVEAVARGVVESISASTVRRWLAGDALKPWQHRSWIQATLTFQCHEGLPVELTDHIDEVPHRAAHPVQLRHHRSVPAA